MSCPNEVRPYAIGVVVALCAPAAADNAHGDCEALARAARDRIWRIERIKRLADSAKCFSRTGELERAIDLWTEIAESPEGPFYQEALAALGWANEVLHHPREAARRYERFTDNLPGYKLARDDLLRAYCLRVQLGDEGAAESDAHMFWQIYYARRENQKLWPPDCDALLKSAPEGEPSEPFRGRSLYPSN
jgi:hypothetical protein